MRMFIVIAAALCACGPSSATPDAAPDAPTVPKSIAGTYNVTSQLDLVAIPPPAQAILVDLQGATDDPDDPALYLVDRLVAGLPEGELRAIAAGLAPLVAPYVQAQLGDVAPNFTPGVRALTNGLGAIAYHVGTIESVQIAPDGTTTRAITGLHLGAATIDFQSEGLGDAIATTRITESTLGGLTVASHQVALPYGHILRLGLDRAVIPSVTAGVGDLASALVALVDCGKLGALFAEHAGIGWPGLYEAACDAGLSTLASDVYAQLAAIDTIPFEISVTGTALGVDVDHDGAMDAIETGTWIGTTTYADTTGALGAATFGGQR